MVNFGKFFYQWSHFNPSANTSWYNVIYPSTAILLLVLAVLGVLLYYFGITRSTVRFVNRTSYFIIMSIFAAIFGLITLLFAVSQKGVGLGDIGIYTFWLVNAIYYAFFFIVLSLFFKSFSRNSKYIPF